MELMNLGSMLRSGTTGRSDPTDSELENILNNESGNLTSYDCPICKNRGFIWHVEDGEKWTEKCKCMKTRAAMTRLNRSGLANAAKNCRLDTFQAAEEWQRVMLDTARAYLADRERNWLFVAGQSGCGKTHICTAVTVKLIRVGLSAHYAQWRELVQRASAVRFDDAKYTALIDPLKRCDVLYIDDLFKTADGKRPPDREFELAFEIINARYVASRAYTIISSEHTLQDLYSLDAALAGRIAERCGKYRVQIAKKSGRNYREKFLSAEI